jgi:hypothetical protein
VDGHLAASGWRRVNVESIPGGADGAFSQSQPALGNSTDSHLTASGWRRVSSESGPNGLSSNRGFGGLGSGGMSGMGGLARSGGGFGGPSGMAFMGGGMGMSSRDCPNCGRKR